MSVCDMLLQTEEQLDKVMITFITLYSICSTILYCLFFLCQTSLSAECAVLMVVHDSLQALVVTKTGELADEVFPENTQK